MEHEHLVDRMMEHYEEALEELMGAQKYAKMSEHAQRQEDKRMYATMAKQEMEHASMICASGDRLVAEAPAEHPLHHVWDRLKKHLHDWKSDIERKITAA